MHRDRRRQEPNSRRSGGLVLWLALAFPPAPALAQNTTTPSPDAGVAVARSAPPEPTSPEALNTLRLRLRRLEAASSAAAEPATLDVPLSSLFAVDLTDDDAVNDRVVLIDERLKRLASQHSDLERVETSSTSTSAARFDPAVVRAALEAKTLRKERALLGLEKSARRSRLDADEARRIHELEREDAKARARAAEEAAATAQAARLRALEEAERAKTEALKALKSRLASVARARAELAEREQRLAERQQATSKTNVEALKRVQELLERETQVRDSAPALVLFGEINAELRRALAVLRKALESLGQDVLVVDVEAGDLKDAERGSPEEREGARELKTALTAYQDSVGKLRRRQKEFRFQAVEAAFKRASALADVRARLLDQIPENARSELMGFSKNGLEAVQLETDLLALGARAQPILHAEKVQRAPDYLRDIVALGITFWAITKVTLVIVLALWVRRRGPELKSWFHAHVRSRVRSVAWLRRLAYLERNVRAFGSYLIFLAAIHLIYWALGPLGRAVEIDLLFTTVLWIAYYWLLRTWLDALVLWLARKRRVFFNTELRQKLQRSTTLVGRTVLVYGLLQSVAVKILRTGVLFHFAQLALVGGVLVVVVVLIRQWRDTIAEAYLEKWPDGPLAHLVRSTPDKFYNLFVVTVALVYVVISGIMVFTKQFLLGFEQSRKALAYVFRMRLERKSELQGTWNADLSDLPPALLSAFTLNALSTANLRVDYFPGREKFERDLEAWKANGPKGSFLLRGGRGYGKSTWIHHALDRVKGVPTRYVALRRTDGTPDSIIAELGSFLALTGEISYDTLVSTLVQGNRQVIAVDDIQHLFFRRMGGSAALGTLMNLIEDTAEQVFWLCAVDSLTWRHICAARPTRIHFRAEHVLSSWPEDRLRQLLMLRAARSGVAHEFEELVIASDSERTEDALVEASEGYTRLIWDYADGCPLVALRFWLHSLVPAGRDRVKVRLFKEPDDARLERIPEEGVFLYAAVANHGALTPEEASEIAGYEEPICEAGLIRGVEEGYLTRSDDGVRFELAVDWQRQMIRFLKARQAL